VITNSSCGSYDAGKTVYSADARCMWSLVKYIDHDPRIYVAAVRDHSRTCRQLVS
jgi:hypothetical protein